MKIGIIGALDEELIPIRALSQHLEKIVKGSRTYWHGDMHGHQVYLTRCDPGKVNAVIAAQQLLDFFEPDCLFNMGSSGALSPDLEVGDLVIATDAIQHDFDLTGWGMKPGEILFDVVTKPETGQLGFTSRHAFVTDPNLTNLAFEAAKSVALDEINGRKPNVYKGRVISGDQFISSVEKAGQLLATHAALAVDMEAAAIAHTCEINKTPFLCVRAMSDKADHSANVSFTDFLVAATDNYGRVFDKLIQQLGR
ncbi:MAG: 5'-methylthioadenosine/adenosylhomocysteine nucleosidase [Anaerolineales bacterium]|jgi:adenosylhomocysteine nucleosidase|nr:5'-methylthioadenosine/adenosylhomocysteine nucleosidase [Anaerolineales bacterium]MCC6987054.1 5'-methylthioadenosine/adenosylhomocysteine nucleosidase [Anaerolineales bacterium]